MRLKYALAAPMAFILVPVKRFFQGTRSSFPSCHLEVSGPALCTSSRRCEYLGAKCIDPLQSYEPKFAQSTIERTKTQKRSFPKLLVQNGQTKRSTYGSKWQKSKRSKKSKKTKLSQKNPKDMFWVKTSPVLDPMETAGRPFCKAVSIAQDAMAYTSTMAGCRRARLATASKKKAWVGEWCVYYFILFFQCFDVCLGQPFFEQFVYRVATGDGSMRWSSSATCKTTRR